MCVYHHRGSVGCLSVAILEEGEQPAGVVAVPVGRDNALDRGRRDLHGLEVAHERERVRSGVKQREVRGRRRVCFRFLDRDERQVSRVKG